MPHGMGLSWFRTTRNHAIDALMGEEEKERRERTAREAGMAGKKSRHWRLVGALELSSIS
ncbi:MULTISPECIES: hypothetical protein [unclassified Cobetia]|uniref:hypothetical protein n=1 Tax=unclassified Cobetia TaxID=2609414 RepID=UPI002096E322|nr:MULTISPECIES: hypothetical protein [unclassified Cobetia]MCO7232613.1 hypothetical protein [Cobetia sp. Dlab-2-AX]MCO7235887.1 hypothetical protein [Cobetia sp. Dlab-2-U]